MPVSCYTSRMTETQISTLSYDPDTAMLDLRLSTGEEYRITNPAHARAIKDKVSVGGTLADVQRFWLEQYRVHVRDSNSERLRSKLAEFRKELRGK